MNTRNCDQCPNHGTYNGYQYFMRHLRNGETPCPAARKQARYYMRNYRGTDVELTLRETTLYSIFFPEAAQDNTLWYGITGTPVKDRIGRGYECNQEMNEHLQNQSHYVTVVNKYPNRDQALVAEEMHIKLAVRKGYNVLNITHNPKKTKNIRRGKMAHSRPKTLTCGHCQTDRPYGEYEGFPHWCMFDTMHFNTWDWRCVWCCDQDCRCCEDDDMKYCLPELAESHKLEEKLLTGTYYVPKVAQESLF